MKPYGVMMVLAIISAGLLLSSCKNDDDGDNAKIELHSFGPSGVKHGENIVFIGRNMDKVTSVVLPGNVEIPSSSFISPTKSQFEITVPAEAEEGKVILKTPQGDITSKSVLSFEVTVVVTSITAEAKPGTNITITGTNVNWIREIVFNNGVVADETNFVSSSVNELVVQVPLEAQTGALIFSTGGTEPETFVSEEELIVTVPTVAALSPASLKHTDELTITGTDLDLITAIDFAGGLTASDFVSQSETEIVVQIPVGTLNGAITLLQASPVSVTSVQSLTIILPKGTGINPPGEVASGDEVTITGTNLDLVASLSLSGVEDAVEVTSFVSQSPTQLVFVVPDGAAAGAIGYETVHGHTAGLGIALLMPGDGPAPLIVVFYDDEVKSGFGQWGENTVWNSTEQVRTGSSSIKGTYGGGNWGIVAQFGGATASTEGTTMFLFSVFGGEGTHGKMLQLLVKADGNENTKQVEISEGAWTDFEIPLSELGNPNTITEFFFQNADFASSSIYIDHVGLR